MGLTREEPRLKVLDVELSQSGVEGSVKAGIIPWRVCGRMRPTVFFKSQPNMLACSDVWDSSTTGYEHDVQISTVNLVGAAGAAFDYPEDLVGIETIETVRVYLLEVFPY